MTRRTWAATAVAAALAFGPVGAATGVAGPDPVEQMSVPSPWVVRGGDPVEVHLPLFLDEGFTHTVEVNLEDLELEHTVDAVDGGFTGAVSVPAEAPCGPVLLEATVSWSYGKDVTEKDYEGRVHVLCPRLQVTPDRLPTSPPGLPLVWEATGFVPDSVVALRLGDLPVRVVATDSEGAARFTAAPPELACRAVTARAADVLTPAERKQREVPADLVVEALDRVDVDCPDRPQPEPSVPAVVQVNPVVVPAGTTTRVSGERFAPGAGVELSWVLPGGRTLPAGTATADPSGSFTTTVLVLVNSGTGARQLVAGAGPAAASDQALVVSGTTQPGRHGLVNRR